MDTKKLIMQAVRIIYFITVAIPLFLIISAGIESAFFLKGFTKLFR